MHRKITSRVTNFALLLLVTLLPAAAFSQITITSPILNSVYQRDVNGQRTITIAGTFSLPVDKIEARAISAVLGQGIDVPWTVIQTNPKGGVYQGDLKQVYAGWYTLEVRGVTGGQVIGRAILQRVGIGEVFIIAGQSNAQGLKKYPGPTAVDDRVQYISNWINDDVDNLGDPETPIFSKITQDLQFMSPRGQSAWCWGLLGDMLVNQLNMPVLFVNTAWEGSSVENWAKSSQGIASSSPWGYPYPTQMPYANLRIAARNYASQYGVRAVLWMQGESETHLGRNETAPVANYRHNLQTVINQLEGDIGKRVTWVIARTSRIALTNSTQNITNAGVIAQQNAVLDQPFNPTWPGPETDPLDPARLGMGDPGVIGDGTHFAGTQSLTLLANAWKNSLNANFFSTATPVTPETVPALSAVCTSSNDGVTITLPEGYKSYKWSNDATTRSITVQNAGTYSAVVKTDQNNSIIVSAVVLEKNAKPVRPSILQSGEQQACADSSFTFSVNNGNDIYSWMKEGSTTVLGTGSSIKIKEAGNYQVRTQNIFGCTSDLSAASKLTIRAKISTPTIAAGGPFSVTATIPETGLNEQFIWRIPGSDQPITAKVVKVEKSGLYSTKAKVVFTLNNNNLTCYSDSASRSFETNNSNEIVVYPNPSIEPKIYVESRLSIKDASVTLYDILGRVVRTLPPRLFDNRIEIDISTLPSGKYIMRVVGENTSLTKNIVIL